MLLHDKKQIDKTPYPSEKNDVFSAEKNGDTQRKEALFSANVSAPCCVALFSANVSALCRVALKKQRNTA